MIVNADHKGRTFGGRTTFRPLIEYEPGDYPPDSRFWRSAADATTNKLRDRLGESYPLWAELTWPGESIEEFTWRDVTEMSQAALDALKRGETDPKHLAAAAWASLGDKHV